MKKYLYIALTAILSVVMTGCGLFGSNDPKDAVKIDPLLLPGRWEAPSQAKGAAEGAKLIFVFQSEACEVSGTNYGKWGYQLEQGDNEPEDWVAAEEQLLDQSAEGDYHKNGWFGWQVLKDGEIQFFHTTSVGDAVTPYTATVKAFSSKEMTLIDAGKTYTFTKVK